ncbi:MAG: hypothetical protein AB7H80_02680 [Candidatus Kapaibacterium sp.]
MVRQFATIFLLIFFLYPTAAMLQAQSLGIENGFPFSADPLDTMSSPYLPTSFQGPAGTHGFLRANEEGNFEFEDGTPVRFVGVTISGNACFPDSVDAIAEARRLRKLGVNLVRFRYMDYSYSWASTLSILNPADGFRSLAPEQARRFDWLVYQLKENGIYSAFTLLSARAPRVEDGFSPEVLDTIPWLGQGLQFIYPQARAAHKHVAGELLNHVNPFTGTAYREEPAVATLEILHRRAMNTFHRLSYDIYSSGSVLNWRHTRRIDTLFNAWLRQKYGSTSALASAWSVTPPGGGYPNSLKGGSFEESQQWDREWSFNAGNGLSVLPVLTRDSVPDGVEALSLRVRDAKNNVYDSYMTQTVNFQFNTIYRLSFKAKCSNPDGRTIRAVAYAGQGGLYPGFNVARDIHPWWEEHEILFLIPVDNGSVVTNLYLYFGDKDGELSIDDMQLREVAPVGLTPGESLENVSVARNRWGENAGLSPQRFLDQYAFYQELDRDYFSDLKRYVTDTIGAEQLVVGAEKIWAGTVMDVAAQRDMDVTMSSQGWDWVSSENGTWHVRNYSPLRQAYGGTIYGNGIFAEAHKPMITSFTTPFPNRYQAESMLQNPAYLMLQDWDGFIYDTWDEDRGDNRRDYIDSADWYAMRNNPVISGMMPAISQIIRHGLISPARTTIRLQHTEDQIKLLPRLAGSWGAYGVPGGVNGFGTTIVRLVVDSLDATQFTQANDFAFPAQADGEVNSDTREIRWEFARGTMTVNTPYVQAATGLLNRPGGISLDLLDVNVFTINESATVLWVPLDPTKMLNQPGRSLLTIVTRSEPTEWSWVDSSTASLWGRGPMLVEPVRVELEFKGAGDVKAVILTPLDQQGMPKGEPLQTTKVGTDYRITINQGETEAVWYSVEYVPSGSDVEDNLSGKEGVVVRGLTNVERERGTVIVDLSKDGEWLQVELYDELGRKVALLREGLFGGGETRVDFSTEEFSSGTYFVRVKGAEGTVGGTTIHIRK